jgi:RNA polymerase sigma-70 factor (ECF subfamily)
MAQDATADTAQPTDGGMIAFEDAALVERCRKGELGAFGALVAKYQDRVYNLILRMVGRQADADELAQETFLKALEKIGQFRGASGFYTWLFRIAANLAISHRRRGGRIRFRPLESDADGEGGLGDAVTSQMASLRQPAPDSTAIAEETRRRVTEALEELDDEFRVVVVLRDVEDMDYAQIAQVLEVPVGTIKSRLHRGRCMLRDKLADYVNP